MLFGGRVIRFLLVIAALCGCAHPRQTWCTTLTLGTDSSCSSLRADDEAAAQRSAEAEHQAGVAGDEHARRDRAAPECARGVAAACLEQAIYDDRHHGDPTAIDRAYRIACDGGSGFACLRAGAYALAWDRPGGPDRDYAKQAYVRGCGRGEVKACRAGAELMPDRAVELDEAACELRDYDACHRAGAAHRYGAGTPLDPVRGAQRLGLACDHGVTAACDELGR